MRSLSGLEERLAHLERMLADPNPLFDPWRWVWRKQRDGIAELIERKKGIGPSI